MSLVRHLTYLLKVGVWIVNLLKKHDHLTFRCDECEFCTNEGDCLIKQFVINHTGDLLKDFGCMSR